MTPKLVYIVSAYKLPEQLVRLVRRLGDDPAADFFIHVDRKTDDATFRRMSVDLGPFPNVHLLERHRCYYGGFGHVEATTKAINEILRRRVRFDHAILLTGQDYPIRSNSEIKDFFRRNSRQSFMEYFPLPNAEWKSGGTDRVDYWHLRFGRRYYRIPGRSLVGFKRRFPSLRLFGGSAYWCLSRECIEYIYGFLRQHRSYARFFKYVNVPEELFFHTIVLNSHLRQHIVNDDLRYLEWRKPETAGGPAILRKHDLDKILQSQKLFARKFDVTEDAEVLDMIDARIT
jgi:hypothetical protein